MPFEECYHTDCPTPKMYISNVILNTTIGIAGITVLNAISTIAKEGVKPLRWQEKSGDEFNDYIVVYCDTGHKNVFPMYTPPNSDNQDEQKKEEQKKEG